LSVLITINPRFRIARFSITDARNRRRRPTYAGRISGQEHRQITKAMQIGAAKMRKRAGQASCRPS